MERKSIYNSIGCTFLSLGLLLMVPNSAVSQANSTPPAPKFSVTVKPLSLAHLYWHFLVYQNQLDTKAGQLDSQGLDGRAMRRHLQDRLGLSDADFSAIRKSSARLAPEVKALNAQAAAIRAGGHTSTSYAQLSALTVQRESDINAEISYLKQMLSPAQIASLESFLTTFFSPTNASPPGSSSGQQAVPAAVQQ